MFAKSCDVESSDVPGKPIKENKSPSNNLHSQKSHSTILNYESVEIISLVFATIRASFIF